uniref:Uncharacterized protein n=1 Tax=Globodera rostochiensis TaxID=31243 RepID=A0A914GZC2_GLORO
MGTSMKTRRGDYLAPDLAVDPMATFLRIICLLPNSTVCAASLRPFSANAKLRMIKSGELSPKFPADEVPALHLPKQWPTGCTRPAGGTSEGICQLTDAVQFHHMFLDLSLLLALPFQLQRTIDGGRVLELRRFVGRMAFWFVVHIERIAGQNGEMGNGVGPEWEWPSSVESHIIDFDDRAHWRREGHRLTGRRERRTPFSKYSCGHISSGPPCGSAPTESAMVEPRQEFGLSDRRNSPAR